jgi:hypothetical protein
MAIGIQLTFPRLITATAATQDTEPETLSRSRPIDNQDIAAFQAATTIATQLTLQISFIKAEINSNGPHCKARSEPEWQPRIFYIWKTSQK